jgi:hypothetical protein
MASNVEDSLIIGRSNRREHFRILVAVLSFRVIKETHGYFVLFEPSVGQHGRIPFRELHLNRSRIEGRFSSCAALAILRY